MAWTTPRTWTTGETVTAALMNAQVRDNLNETDAASVSAAGDLVYADAANSMGSSLAIGSTNQMLCSDGSGPVWRTPNGDYDSGTGSGTGTSFQGLAALTSYAFAAEIYVTVTTGTVALIAYQATMSNSNAGSTTYLNMAITGATTASASNKWEANYESTAANDRARIGVTVIEDGLTAGSNTFTLQGKVSAGTGTFSYPIISVVAF